MRRKQRPNDRTPGPASMRDRSDVIEESWQTFHQDFGARVATIRSDSTERDMLSMIRDATASLASYTFEEFKAGRSDKGPAGRKVRESAYRNALSIAAAGYRMAFLAQMRRLHNGDIKP